MRRSTEMKKQKNLIRHNFLILKNVKRNRSYYEIIKIPILFLRQQNVCLRRMLSLFAQLCIKKKKKQEKEDNGQNQIHATEFSISYLKCT
jgi:hypothetical protein